MEYLSVYIFSFFFFLAITTFFLWPYPFSLYPSLLAKRFIRHFCFGCISHAFVDSLSNNYFTFLIARKFTEKRKENAEKCNGINAKNV